MRAACASGEQGQVGAAHHGAAHHPKHAQQPDLAASGARSPALCCPPCRPSQPERARAPISSPLFPALPQLPRATCAPGAPGSPSKVSASGGSRARHLETYSKAGAPGTGGARPSAASAARGSNAGDAKSSAPGGGGGWGCSFGGRRCCGGCWTCCLSACSRGAGVPLAVGASGLHSAPPLAAHSSCSIAAPRRPRWRGRAARSGGPRRATDGRFSPCAQAQDQCPIKRAAEDMAASGRE